MGYYNVFALYRIVACCSNMQYSKLCWIKKLTCCIFMSAKHYGGNRAENNCLRSIVYKVEKSDRSIQFSLC